MAAAITSLSLLRNPVRTMALRATLTNSPGSVRLSLCSSPLVTKPTSSSTTPLCSRFSSRHTIRTICNASSPHDEEAAAKVAAVNADTGAPTIFDKIISKEIPATIVYEDEKVLAFRDINPQAPVHVLVIPKLRDGLTELGKAEERHSEILGHLLYAAKLVAEKEGIKDGFRVVINSGPDACQSVYHLHLHVLGGRQMKWPPGKKKYCIQLEKNRSIGVVKVLHFHKFHQSISF